MKNLEEKDPDAKKRAEARHASNALFYDPPVVIFCTLKKSGIATKETDLGLAVENMMLMAQALGLATLPAAYPKWFGEEVVKRELKIPEDEEFFLSLSLGYPDPEEKKTPHPRKDLSEVATFIY